MNRLMPPHRGYSGDRLPPLKLLEPLIDKESSQHWYWNGDFLEDGFDLRYASFVWSPPNENPVFYCVARVLWAYHKRQSLFRKRFRNLCGLTTCVNPAHFDISFSRADAHGPVTLPADVRLSDGTSARLVYLHSQPTVHILRDDTAYTACYAAALRSVETAPAGAVITCPRCVSSWRSACHPLQSVSILDEP